MVKKKKKKKKRKRKKNHTRKQKSSQYLWDKLSLNWSEICRIDRFLVPFFLPSNCSCPHYSPSLFLLVCVLRRRTLAACLLVLKVSLWRVRSTQLHVSGGSKNSKMDICPPVGLVGRVKRCHNIHNSDTPIATSHLLMSYLFNTQVLNT